MHGVTKSTPAARFRFSDMRHIPQHNKERDRRFVFSIMAFAQDEDVKREPYHDGRSATFYTEEQVIEAFRAELRAIAEEAEKRSAQAAAVQDGNIPS